MISIIIPNWNGKLLLEKNLPSIIKASENNKDNVEIIVVDDGSTDGSSEFLIKNFSKVIVINKEKNEGFSSSVNLGVENAKGDIVVLLNSDTSPEENFLSPLVEHFKDLEVFSVGCLDKSYEGNKIIDRGRGIGTFQRGMIIHAKGEIKAGISFWTSGGSSAFDRKKWLRLGGFDRILDPFYGEDLDLGFRAWKAGYKVLFEPRSIVHHYHEQGVIIKNFSTSYKYSITFRNQLIFIWKNISDKKMLLNNILWLPYHLLYKPFFTKDFTKINGFIWAISLLPKIIDKRIKTQTLFVKRDNAIFSLFENEK